MHRCIQWVFLAVFILSQASTGVQAVRAQGQQYMPGDGNVDVEPPLIEHDVIAESEADIRQTFVATVVDDEELDSVVFYYRFTGETSFSRYVMMQVSYSSTYVAQIPTDPNSFKAIEYYIQARDTSGNRTVRGYIFSPLVRQIVPPVSQVAEAAVQAESAGKTDTPSRGHVPRAVYIVGGVMLLGLIASVASSSNDGSGQGSNSDECTTAGCRLTLTVNRPF